MTFSPAMGMSDQGMEIRVHKQRTIQDSMHRIGMVKGKLKTLDILWIDGRNLCVISGSR